MTSPLWHRVDAAEQEIVEAHMTDLPVKVGLIATELGLKVTRSVMDPKISGLIQPDQTARAGYEIRVNKYETKERQRFTVAHELAHFLLHRGYIGQGVIDSVMYRSALSSRREVEANQMAADICMPQAAIQRELRILGGLGNEATAAKLAEAFGVSLPAMKVRLGLA